MRSRLSLHDFNTILDMINDENHWLANAMKIALITGQRISDISKMKLEDIYDYKLLIFQQKIENKIAIPFDIENMKLRNILKNINQYSEFVISTKNKKITPEKTSIQFVKIRDKINSKWEGSSPSFHEIRSLSARLYTDKMNSDLAQKLLGHKSADMTVTY